MRLLIILIAFLFSSCSAEKLIQRAYKKDPSLLKQDTLVIPEVRIDTFYNIDTIEIKQDLDSSLGILDSCPPGVKEQVIQIVTDYITEDLLEDTLFYQRTIITDSAEVTLNLKIWQEDKQFKFEAYIADSQFIIPAPVIIKQDTLLDKKEEIILMILFGISILLLIRRYGRF
jgi:hypothetical protein